MPYAQSVEMAAALAAAGVVHELVTIPDGPHGFDRDARLEDGSPAGSALARAVAFMASHWGCDVCQTRPDPCSTGSTAQTINPPPGRRSRRRTSRRSRTDNPRGPSPRMATEITTDNYPSSASITTASSRGNQRGVADQTV